MTPLARDTLTAAAADLGSYAAAIRDVLGIAWPYLAGCILILWATARKL
mgnify:CR=1 FL=1